ncbi:hypothetical protein CHS0354_014251 [Potamilus streckersoni]|uniref:G-protein coupled receptors family 1 profile domain-containing protein n=1 Tax=Potamilus streckersoni TaxID=2493646 RepID=A0AAE0T1N6_9BIVA|nr:hypothetical protein CHS0354_014251 [Potamilus streckersoni]
MFTSLKELPEGRNWTLDELNERKVQLLIPVIIFISIAMVVGIIGNALVLYINIFVFKMGTSTHRYFIVFLALADASFCMICDPFLIWILYHPYTFTNTLACKSLRAFTYFNALVSVLVLSVIALDRYRRICRPNGNKFSIPRTKFIFGIIAILSFIFSIPAFILYGPNTVQTGVPNITGTQCFPDDLYKDTMFPNGYYLFLYTVFIIVTISMSVLYTLIWYQIRKHKNPIMARSLYHSTKHNALYNTMESNAAELFSCSINMHNPGKCIIVGNKPNKPELLSNRVKTIRVSKMLLVVTAFFVLSFAPFLSLGLLTFFDEQVIEDLDNTSTMIYHLFWSSFEINFMINPFIYGAMDKRFREECD